MKLTTEEVNRAAEAIKRARAWMDAHRAEVDKDQDLMTHYKGVYMSAVSGDRALARRYADKIATRYIQSDGDFRTKDDWKGWERLPCAPANRYVYSNGWIVVGLQRMAEYAMARKGMEFILRFQSPTSGGFYSRFDPKTKEIKKDEINSGSTSSAGLALLACNRGEEAVKAGDFLLRLIEEQPDPENHFFVTYRDNVGVLTDVFGIEDVNDAGSRQHFCVNRKTDPRRELMWQIGKPMKLLAALYGATGEQRFLDGVDWLLDFFDSIDDKKWDNLGTCKIMWGSAEAFWHTGKEKYFSPARRFLLFLCDVQTEWGGWIDKLWVKDPDALPAVAHFDVMQEMCSEISDAVYCLSGETPFEVNPE